MRDAHVIYLLSKIKYGNSRLEKAEALGKLCDHEFWVQCKKMRLEYPTAINAPLDYLVLAMYGDKLQ